MLERIDDFVPEPYIYAFGFALILQFLRVVSTRIPPDQSWLRWILLVLWVPIALGAILFVGIYIAVFFFATNGGSSILGVFWPLATPIIVILGIWHLARTSRGIVGAGKPPNLSE